MKNIALQRDLMQTRLRAIVELVDGELVIYPIAESDREARDILAALRFLREDFPG